VTGRHDPQLLKGVLTMLLLQLLREQESYGYEVVQRVHDLGLPDVLEGTVYPALARLEREGWVTTRLVASSAGPARKYYRPTPSGRRALEQAISDWTALVGIVDAALRAPQPDEEIGA